MGIANMSTNGLTQSVLRKQAEDNVVGKLTNWRNLSHKGKGDVGLYKQKILSGENKIMGIVLRGMKNQVKLIKGEI